MLPSSGVKTSTYEFGGTQAFRPQHMAIVNPQILGERDLHGHRRPSVRESRLGPVVRGHLSDALDRPGFGPHAGPLQP